jgi:hypothetical protein
MARLQVFMAALWWGSLCAVGFMVVPLLFVHLETTALAGQMAAKLFTAQSWLSLSCGLLLLEAAQRLRRDGLHTPSPWVVAGMLFALLLEVAVKPHIMARDQLVLWHNLGSAFYLLQWMCSSKVLWAVCRVSSEPNISIKSEQAD